MPPPTVVRVPGFVPSQNGFPFSNAWPSNPIRLFQLGTVATLNIGDAANGLCGGMSFTTADLHVNGARYDGSPQPADGTDRYAYIVNRQIDSFEDGVVPLRFFSLMSPGRPERESALAVLLGRFGIDRHSRAYVMVHEEWPTIRAAIDTGQLAMIGLVRIVSSKPTDLSHNHQVLAYGYDLDGPTVTIRICDPNWPQADDVTITFDASDPMASVQPIWSRTDADLVCFFHAPYAPARPTPFLPAL